MAKVTATEITQDELSSILAGNVESVLTPKQEETEVEKVEDKVAPEVKSEVFKKPIDTEFKWTDFEKEKEDVPALGSASATETATGKKIETKKSGDFLEAVNELVTKGDLVGFEDGVIKSLDEAKELIRLNVQEAKKSGFEEVWKEKVESFSPQVQAILKYAETGGQDIMPLLNAISQVEKVSEFDIETEEGQEEIIREYLKVQGWDNEDIKEEIETAKDLNKLKTKAEKFQPKLDQMHQQRVEQMMSQQVEVEKEAETARQNYLGTIRTTLSKEKIGDVKLGRQDKAMLWDSLTDIKYKSWSGQSTNKFFKTLEELQAGKTADYDLFLEIVHMTVDPKGYKEKLKAELKTAETVETARKLKVDQKRINNSETLFEEEQKKPTISRTGFKNPFA